MASFINNTAAAFGAAAITPSDSASVAQTRALYVGGAGDVAAVMARGDTVTFSGVVAGTVLPVQVIKVLSVGSGTTATNILGLY